MTNAELKREILAAMADLIEYNPDVRFGQLIGNLAVIARDPSPEAVWDMEDDELLLAVRSLTETFERRQAAIVATS